MQLNFVYIIKLLCMNTYIKLRVCILIFFTIFLFGCEKDELTYTVKVNFNIGINQESDQQTYLILRKGVIALKGVTFLGMREQGENIFFETRPDKSHGTYIISAGQSAQYITYFDIPQGVYNLMKWDITIDEIDDDLFDEKNVDSDDYGFLVSGIYTKLDGTNIPIFFTINPSEDLSCEAKNTNGITPISIKEGNTYTLLIELNPSLAIDGIDRDYFEKAIIETDDEDKYILVSSETNVNLHQLFLFRLEKTLKATVQ